MINVRLVGNISKDGNEFTLVNVKVLAENPNDKKRVEANREVNEAFTDVQALFTALKDTVISLIQSGYV